MRGEFRADGRGTDELVVPVERFLAHRPLLRRVCKRHRVALVPDDTTRELLESRLADEQRLQEVREAAPRLSEDEVRERLEGTRFTRELRPFQMRDLRRLLALPHGANFSVPGAGKTCVTYALYEAERAAGRVEQMLVVAPLSAFDAWEGEAEASLDPAPTVHRYIDRAPASAEVLLTGYQRLWSRYDELAAWAARHDTHVVLDEAHRIKRGREGEWGSTALDLAYAARRRDILTGTPAPNRPDDVEAQLDFLWPTQGRHIVPRAVKGSGPWPADAGEQIAENIGPLFVRTKKDELGLPPVEHEPIILPLEGLQKEIYRALRSRYAGRFRLGRFGAVNLAKMGEVVMYLLEAATNPALLAAGSSEDDPVSFRHPPIELKGHEDLLQLLNNYPDHETPRKFLKLYELVQQKVEAGRKVLVWSNFVKNIKMLEHELRRYQPALLYGEIKQVVSDPERERSRKQEIERFRHDPDCQVMLANPAAASEGMSLHDVCHEAIYLERTFNAGQYLQSVDRIHRLGLEPGTVTRITHLITQNTIDEVVDQRIREKAARLGDILEDPNIEIMALPGEGDYGHDLQQADYRALVDHLSGADAS
jgi:SNF2 family DNA or RNA helicase